jgi:hypothetical protein
MDWIAAVLLWVGNFILIKKKHWVCFVIFAVANTMWFVYWFTKHEWAAMILVASFLAMNVWGVISWRKK